MKDDHTSHPLGSRQVSPEPRASSDAASGGANHSAFGVSSEIADASMGHGMGTGFGTGLSPVGAPIPIEINRTLAELLARLCVELGTEDHVGVLSRALGLLEMVQRTKRQGGRLCFINERGETADVIA